MLDIQMNRSQRRAQMRQKKRAVAVEKELPVQTRINKVNGQVRLTFSKHVNNLNTTPDVAKQIATAMLDLVLQIEAEAQ